MNDSEEHHLNDNDDAPRSDKAPSSTAVGLTAWGCLMPNLLFCGFLLAIFLSEGSVDTEITALAFAAVALMLLLMIFLLRNRSRQILIASLIIGFGFWLLLFGLCVGGMG